MSNRIELEASYILEKDYNFIYALFLIIMAFFIGIIISSIINKKVENSLKVLYNIFEKQIQERGCFLC